MTDTDLRRLRMLLRAALDDEQIAGRKVTPTGSKRSGTDLVRALDAVTAALDERAPISIVAGDLQAGEFVRIENGPKAGQTGTVEALTLADQFRTGYAVAIIDMTDGRRVVRMQSDPVTVLRAGS